MKEKICSTCGKVKPLSDYARYKRRKDGHSTRCKTCDNEVARVYRSSDSRKSTLMVREYGITLEQHKSMYIDQNGRCALCGEPVPYDMVNTDHDHKTGKIRGILCRKCNMGLGLLGDNVEGLKTALRYLEDKG